MNSMGLFAKSVIATTFLWTFLQSIMPGEKYKKCSDFVYGLVIISMVVSLALNIEQFEVSDFLSDTGAVSNYSNSYILDLYEQKLSEALQKKFDDKSIKAELDENYKIVSITCDNKTTQKEIEEYLNE